MLDSRTRRRADRSRRALARLEQEVAPIKRFGNDFANWWVSLAAGRSSATRRPASASIRSPPPSTSASRPSATSSSEVLILAAAAASASRPAGHAVFYPPPASASATTTLARHLPHHRDGSVVRPRPPEVAKAGTRRGARRSRARNEATGDGAVEGPPSGGEGACPSFRSIQPVRRDEAAVDFRGGCRSRSCSPATRGERARRDRDVVDAAKTAHRRHAFHLRAGRVEERRQPASRPSPRRRVRAHARRELDHRAQRS